MASQSSSSATNASTANASANGSLIGSQSSTANTQHVSSTTINYPPYTISPRIGGFTTWQGTDAADDYYITMPRAPFVYNLDIDEMVEDLGFKFAAEGLYKTILMTFEQSEIVKIWETHEGSVEEFFVLGAINGCIDIDIAIMIAEVSLKKLLRLNFYDIPKVEGMAKHFFKLLEHTPYLDEWVLKDKFVIYWLDRRQNLSDQTDAFKLVTYMLKIILDKRKEMANKPGL